jgi:hypothetical protein
MSLGVHRYRLHAPAAVYASTYTSVQQKVEMCDVALGLMKDNKKLTPETAAQEAAAELGLPEDHKDVEFAEEQVAAWTEVKAFAVYFHVPCSLRSTPSLHCSRVQICTLLQLTLPSVVTDAHTKCVNTLLIIRDQL